MSLEAKSSPKTDSGPLPAKNTGEYPVTKKELLRQLRFQDLLIIGSVIATVVTGVFSGYFKVVQDARAETELVVKPLEFRISTLEQNQTNLRGDVHEVQLDLRELYKVIRENRRSVRLENAPPEDDDSTVRK